MKSCYKIIISTLINNKLGDDKSFKINFNKENIVRIFLLEIILSQASFFSDILE